MHLRDESLTGDNLAEALAFMRASNPFAQKVWGWDTGRFVDWRWGINTIFEAASPDWFSRHGRLFRDDSGIRALTIAEYGSESECIITGRPDPEAVAQAFRWLIDRHTDRGMGLRFDFSDAEHWLRELFESFGFVDEGASGIEWEYDLRNLGHAPPVAEGFVIESLLDARDGEHAGIAACIRAGFGIEVDHEPGLRSIESSPFFRPELSVIARGPDGRIAAYCRGTVDPDNGVCGIDPVVCHPDFQRMGLSKAVVHACFTTQRALGGRFSYIGSAPEPAPGTFLYQSLAPSSRTTMSTWSLRKASI
jgi:hypothetical protein